MNKVCLWYLICDNRVVCTLQCACFSPLRYYSQCMFQHTGQELADNLKVCMAAALRKYHEVNKMLPERIIVYRDGVGDGQVRGDGMRG